MPRFETLHLVDAIETTAPDGSTVHVLLSLAGGSMAQFTLAPGHTSVAVAHRTVEEIWLITGGCGEMWRANVAQEEITPLQPGTCLTIPVGTRFQFRALGDAPLTAIAATMPPWPGSGEAYQVNGHWPAQGSG